ncbi:MAG: hypothetical protein IT335_07230 [Thermomicrobiales bacterium]|nr:hypothetical protein [Thermomicrobiales bacterium]
MIGRFNSLFTRPESHKPKRTSRLKRIGKRAALVHVSSVQFGPVGFAVALARSDIAAGVLEGQKEFIVETATGIEVVAVGAAQRVRHPGKLKKDWKTAKVLAETGADAAMHPKRTLKRTRRVIEAGYEAFKDADARERARMLSKLGLEVGTAFIPVAGPALKGVKGVSAAGRVAKAASRRPHVPVRTPRPLPPRRGAGHLESGNWEDGGQGTLFPRSDSRSPASPGVARATPGRIPSGSLARGDRIGWELGQGQLFNPAVTFGRTADLDAYLGGTFGGFDRYVESVSRNVLGTNLGVAPGSLISRHGDASISAVISTIPPYSRSSFGVGPTIHAGARWGWVDDSGVGHNVKMHSIDFADHQGLILADANTRAGYTMQYQVGNKFLTTSGDFIRLPKKPKMPPVVWDYLTSIRKAEAGGLQSGALKPPTVDGRPLSIKELTNYQNQFDTYNAKMESIHIPLRE